MLRYHLNDFLRRHIWIQYLFSICMYSLFTVYIVFYALDLVNLLDSVIMNYRLVTYDTDVKVIDSYELSGNTLFIDNEKFENINIAFYGVCTEDTNVYFNKESNTLIQSLPNNFGVSFMLSSKMFIVMFSLIFCTVGAYYISSNKYLKLEAFDKVTFRYLLGLAIVYIVFMLITFLALY